MKSRGRTFLVIWLLCLAAGIVVGFITGALVQALNPPPPGDEGNMAYGFYVLFWVLGAVNVTNYAVAIYVGTRYVKREQGDLRPYLMKAIGFSALGFVLTFVICPLVLANSLIAAGIATVCIRTGGKPPSMSSEKDFWN